MGTILRFAFINFILISGIFSQENEFILPFPDDLKPEPKEENAKKMETSTDDFQNELKKLDENKKAETIELEKKETVPNSLPLKSKIEKESNLPNLTDKKNKKAKKQAPKGKEILTDASQPPHERGTILLQRQMTEKARAEFKESILKEKDFSFKSRLEEIRLLGMEKKTEEAKNLALNIENPDEKFQALFELARSLDNGDSKTREDSISIYTIVVTEAPKTEKIRLRSLWALSHLLYRNLDFQNSLYFLSDILHNHKDSEFYDNAIYLCGKIYEKPWPGKDLEKSRKFFAAFLDKESEENFRNSEYLEEVKKRIHDTL